MIHFSRQVKVIRSQLVTNQFCSIPFEIDRGNVLRAKIDVKKSLNLINGFFPSATR